MTKHPFHVTHVRFEHLSPDAALGVSQPRISWKTETAQTSWMQQAYEIERIDSEGQPYCTTGRVDSDQSVLVAWPFSPLASREQVTVRVRVWDTDGQLSEWSEPATTEAALLQPADWSAHFITPNWDEDLTRPQPAPLLRREFTLEKPVRRARLYITALGVYEALINGHVVGDQVLAPGWTSYPYRLGYQTYDVTGLLRAGQNAIGAMLGDGWFRGRLGYGGGRRNIFGDRLALLAQLEITFADGSTARVVSDENWRAATGPIQGSDIYDGETYDARLERAGWDQAGYDDSSWAGVRLLERSLDTLFACYTPPVRRIEVWPAARVIHSPSGKTILDFGQNVVGRLRLHVPQGPAGQTITLRHAEVLENGEVCVRTLRYAKAIDQYTLKGGGVETWEPRFTFHGFRYAEVSGWPGEINPGDVQAVICHSDMERTGWFDCSDDLVNRLHENVVWSMRGNFFYIPTDCPQRDERLGWTGDIQVFSPTASFLYNCAGFLSSWLEDLAAEQAASGSVPFYAPIVSPRPEPTPPSAAWGDAAVIVPWVLYQRFGDKNILERQFESMRAWVEQIHSLTGPSLLWDKGTQFGDWLDPAAPPDRPGAARTPNYVLCTAYFAHSTELVSRAAGILGRTAEEEQYRALAAAIRAAFQHNYVTPAGRILGDSATAYSLALQFALLPGEDQRRAAGQRLAELLRANRYRISSGFVGTVLVCDALCNAGHPEAAFRLLMQTENPSWLYPVTMGATTVWERWDSMLPDGTVNPGEMTSFNHYALGAVADWLHRGVAGLAPAAPGYRQIEIRPLPGGGLTHARAKLNTPYGMAESAWEIAGGQFHLDVTLPPNTTGAVILPGHANKQPITIGAGKHHWSVPYTIEAQKRSDLSMNTTLDELQDDPQAYAAVMKLFRVLNDELTDRMEGQLWMSLHEAARLHPDPVAVSARLEEGLAELNHRSN